MLLFANKAAVVDYAMCADLIYKRLAQWGGGGGGGVTFSFHSTVCNKQIWNREKKRNIPAHVQPDAHPASAAARCQSSWAIFSKHKWKCVFLHLQMFTRGFKSRNGKRVFLVKHLNAFLSKKVCCLSWNVQISLIRALWRVQHVRNTFEIP